MIEILLTRDKTAKVNDEDHGHVSKLCWHTKITGKDGRTCQAVHSGKDRKSIYMHRFIWELHFGPILAGMELDHINGDGLDNRLENLRMVTHAQNQCNQHPSKIGCTSKYKGVYYYKKYDKWRAQIKSVGIMMFIGYFDIEREAALAYNRAAKEEFGEFACLNVLVES